MTDPEKPSVDGVVLTAGDRRLWVDPDADPNQENGIYEVEVLAPAVDAHHQGNRLAVLAGALARRLGMRVGVYGSVLQIDLPTGQVTFRLDATDEQWAVFGPDWSMVCDHDGHDDAEKWSRVARFVAQHAVHSSVETLAESFRRSVGSLEEALARARHQREASGGGSPALARTCRSNA